MSQGSLGKAISRKAEGQCGWGVLGGALVKQTAQLQGTVVKKIKLASQLSVFYQCKC